MALGGQGHDALRAARRWQDGARPRLHLAGLGHQGEVPSPSFSIVQPYEALDPPVWHVDLYRIEDMSEIDELGLDFAADAVMLVEWPERAGDRAWPQALVLSLDFGQDGGRI